MAKAYWVVVYHAMKNPEAFAAYAKLAPAATAAFGGRYLVRNTPAKIYEKGLNQRVVIVEFDSLEKAIGAHDSAAYQAALKAMGDNAVERDLRIVEGLA